jgi:hypothetical protein
MGDEGFEGKWCEDSRRKTRWTRKIKTETRRREVRNRTMAE